MIAYSTPWGTIRLGAEFYLLTRPERMAVIAHEKGHIRHRHAQTRLLWLVTLKAFFHTDEFLEMCKAQEFEADQYAADHGHAAGMITFLSRKPFREGPGHPLNRKRIEALYE